MAWPVKLDLYAPEAKIAKALAAAYAAGEMNYSEFLRMATHYGYRCPVLDAPQAVDGYWWYWGN